MHITYGKHHLDEKDIQAVIKVLKSSNLTQGITVKNFEKELKNILGLIIVPFCLMELQHFI